jgi:hypothetical protein
MEEYRDASQDNMAWKALPPLEGGVFVAMVTEVLNKEGIPSMVKTDLEAGGLGMITGTVHVGAPYRIKVPESDYDKALEIFEELMGGLPPSEHESTTE